MSACRLRKVPAVVALQPQLPSWTWRIRCAQNATVMRRLETGFKYLCISTNLRYQIVAHQSADLEALRGCQLAAACVNLSICALYSTGRRFMFYRNLLCRGRQIYRASQQRSDRNLMILGRFLLNKLKLLKLPPSTNLQLSRLPSSGATSHFQPLMQHASSWCSVPTLPVAAPQCFYLLFYTVCTHLQDASLIAR